MSELRQILSGIEQGDPRAASQLLPLVYDELRKLAAQRMTREMPGQTLQATALVHEAYLRLVGTDPARPWNGRAHFFAAAAEAMRRILVDRARDHGRIKRGGGRKRTDIDIGSLQAADAPVDDLLDLSAAIDRLAAVDTQSAALVKLRIFVGMTVAQAAETLGISLRTAERDWAFARTWLFEQLGPRNDES